MNDEHALLSRPELRVLLLKHYRTSEQCQHRGEAAHLEGSKKFSDTLTIIDIARACRMKWTILQAIMRDDHRPDKWQNRTLFAGPHRRLSRFMLKLEAGMIEKKGGELIYHEQPTKPMPALRRFVLGSDGPKVLLSRQLEAPRVMPRFSSVFASDAPPKLPFVRG